MTVPRSLAIATIALLGSATLLLSACSAGAEPTPTATSGAEEPSAAPTDAQPAPSASASAPAADATCETIVGEDLLAELDAQSWTVKEAPFTAGGVALEDGLQCTWADYSVGAGPSLLFGWAPITAEDAETMQSGLGTEGWLREETDGNVYITEDPMQAPTTDENGYGMTYQFGDGWVTVSDTKQGLLLINRP